MKLTYDPELNIAYIRFRKKSGRVKTVQVSAELNIDLAADGKIYGIELLNANEQLAKGKNVVLENVTTGSRQKLSLAS
ncbi:MAG: DUF2283 domain-containing protein [Chloroflexota bacterium]